MGLKLRLMSITTHFLNHFEQLAENPWLYQAVDDIREGYRRSVCGVDSIYYRIDGENH